MGVTETQQAAVAQHMHATSLAARTVHTAPRSHTMMVQTLCTPSIGVAETLLGWWRQQPLEHLRRAPTGAPYHWTHTDRCARRHT